MNPLFSFLTIIKIIIVFSSIPNWQLDNLSIELFSSSSSSEEYEYILYSGYGCDLKKTITKNADKIISTNYLICGSTKKQVDFEDIESCYDNQLGNGFLVCPKGSFHPYDYYNGNYIKPFTEEGKWELSCYKHNTGYFLMFYSHNGNKALYYTKGNNKDIKTFGSFDEIYGYKLPEYENKGQNYEYKLPCLRKAGEDLIFSGFNLIMNSGENQINSNQIQGSTTIIKAKKDTQGSFDSNYNYYYFTYNNVSDFASGYSNTYVDISNGNYANSFSITKTEKSPLTFIDNVEIEEMKFIPGTKYIYYKIYNIDKNTTYSGLMDVKENKVLYNIEGDIKQFIPDKNGQMLAITDNSLYKVCIVKSSDGNSCDNECTTVLLDSEGNKCQTNCDRGKIKLIPEGICIKKELCDLNIYVLNEDETECGLCNDFYPNGAKYRLINSPGCLENMPSNTKYYNELWNLLECKTNYHLDNNQCKPDSCYDTCQTCSEVSNDINDQKCLTCKTNYILKNGNCIIAPTTIPIIPPTTIVEKIPTTIIIPPTTVINPIPTTLIIPPTTIINPIPTTLIMPPTTVVKPVLTTVIVPFPTTIIKTIPEVKCPSEKCLTCNEESNKLGLCLTCNEAKGYMKVNYTIVLTKFLDCIKKESPKLINFYYNETLKEYRPCYKTCKKCLMGGDPQYHNCLECENGYMFRPGDNPHNNCVAYSEYHYITSYNQYKGLDIYQCPEEAKYYIKEKKSCIDDCKRDNEYKYLYNGNCIKQCPEGTNANNYICLVNSNKCKLGKNEIYLAEKDKLDIIEILVKSYISEFYYTNHYVSYYYHSNYDIIIYKDTNCIKELSLEMPDVNFQSCYEKVQQEIGIYDYLIIVIVVKKEIKNPTTFYSFYHPKSGLKLDADKICKDDTIIVLENLNSVLDKNDTYYETQTSLTSQGINIFDVNDPFYTDICYDFDNPLKKDIPLNDRIKYIYPNASLCDDGCQYKGINLEDMTSTCDCKFNDITNNNIIKDNAFMNEAVGEIVDIINSSNILVFKCFKFIFKHFAKSYGGWISLILITTHIGMTLLYFLLDSVKVRKYIFSLTYNYIKILQNSGKKNGLLPPKRNLGNTNNNTNNNKHIVNDINYIPADSETKLKNNKLKLKPLKIVKSKISNKDIVIPYKDQKALKISNDIYPNTEENLKPSDKNLELKVDLYDKQFFKEYMSTSIDDMEFDDAVVYDKRKYIEHLIENLKEDQIIPNTFIAEDKLKPRSIKVMVLLLNVMFYFIINGFFFSEEVISELYHIDEEKENFFSFIPRSITRLIYTTLVSIIIDIIVNFFFVEEKKIKGIFRRGKDNTQSLRKNMAEFMKDLKTRYLGFIIFVPIILIISFFYLLCFNYVYPYSQIEWIKSSIAIIIIMQILSTLKCILETSLRFLSYKFRSEKLYKISKFLD